MPPALAGSYDYVVVGGGSSGCVAASRLAEAGHTVLLLECGEPAESNPETLEADGYKKAFANDNVMWERFSVPQPACKNNRLFMGSGKGMGGSGSINGMVYTRGAAKDYAEWPQGWNWDDVVDDFEAVESVLRVRRREETRWTKQCITAATQTGFRAKDDLNDGDLSGVLGYEFMNYEGDRRRSSYVGFVKDKALDTLTVETQARGQRIRFDEDRRAVGVDYECHGASRSVGVNREVIMCAGALETPKLLMLSGVGPGHELAEHGIEVVADRREVGRNFHDHPNVCLFFRGKNDVDCNYPQLYGFHRANHMSGLPAGQSDTCYVFYPARSSLVEAAVRLVPGMMLPPSLYALPPIVRTVRRGIGLTLGSAPMRRAIERVFGIVVILGKPKSRGSISLRSRNPRDTAVIDPAYFADPSDLDTMVEGVRFARRISQAPALEEWGNSELIPGKRKKTEDAIADWVRSAVMTTYHFAGTCRMGADDEAVVDTKLKVRGVQGLRIADASVVPTTPVSAMNAPSMLVGYRAASFALEEANNGRSS